MDSSPFPTKAMDSVKIVGRWIDSSHELGEVHVFVTPVGGLIEPIMPDTKFRYWGQVIFTGDKPFWMGGPDHYIPGGADSVYASPEEALAAGRRRGEQFLVEAVRAK